MNSYMALSGTLADLRRQGYTEDFNLHQDSLQCINSGCRIIANQLKVDNYYRFEGHSDPGDQAIVYAISSDAHNLKGVLVNAYGIYSDPLTDEMVKSLDIRKA